MAYPDVKEAQGVTVICGSGWTAEMIDIKKTGPKWTKLDVTKLSSTSRMEFIRSSLADSGEVDITVHFNPDNPYPETSATDTIQILYPPIGTATSATARSSTISNGFLLEAPHSIPLGKIMEGTIKICLTGVSTHVNTQ